VRILFLQKRLLLPCDTGGKIRTLNVLRHLAKWHEVTYLCNLQESESIYVDELRSTGVELKTVPWVEAPRRSLRFLLFAVRNLLSKYPLNVDKDYDPHLRRVAEELVQEGNHDLLICDFVQMARNCLLLDLPKLLFQHNVEAEIFERLSQRVRGPWSWYLRRQAARMRCFESDAGADFDGVVAVSRRDQQQFRDRYDWKQVDVIDTAVDVDYYSPSPTSGKTSSRSIVFIGSMDWPPNQEGVLHFVQSIWPQVLAKHPDVEFTIVGRHPSASIRSLERLPNIQVTGGVADTRPYLDRALLSIVPLYSGGGTRLKIFESMAMKCPVVSTSLGAEGLEVVDGEHLKIRDSDQEFSNSISELVSDKRQRERLSQAAYLLVHDRYTSKKVAKQFDLLCHKAVATWRERKSIEVHNNV